MMPSTDRREAFDGPLTDVLRSFVDCLIPGNDGFPAASETSLVEEFLVHTVTAGSIHEAFYPGTTMSDLNELVRDLGSEFAIVGRSDQMKIVGRVAAESGELFERIRALVYYGYYSRPTVAAAIARTLPAAHDFHGPPQPCGYASVIEPWDQSDFEAVRGSYTRTEDVARVDLTVLRESVRP